MPSSSSHRSAKSKKSKKSKASPTPPEEKAGSEALATEAKQLLNTMRGQYIISQALCLAIESIEKRPPELQEISNMYDMKLLLHLFPIYPAVMRATKEAMSSGHWRKIMEEVKKISEEPMIKACCTDCGKPE